jgi:hypothetical protein
MDVHVERADLRDARRDGRGMREPRHRDLLASAGQPDRQRIRGSALLGRRRLDSALGGRQRDATRRGQRARIDQVETFVRHDRGQHAECRRREQRLARA